MTLDPGADDRPGPHAWWLPRWLDRILPNVDLEGASLDKDRAEAPRVLAESLSR